MAPTEPPPSAWALPDAAAHRGDVVGVGADLEPGTLLAGYRAGLFPMPAGGRDMEWWSPDPRGILPLENAHVSRSLRRSIPRYHTTVDADFGAVVRACARLPRAHGWITPDIERAYLRLHGLGWAHSVETYSDGKLVGGLYGVAVGGLFAGESMFHTAPDASKVALVRLMEVLGGDPVARAERLLDVQWRTPHLASLGAVEVTRAEYLRRLAAALLLPLPALWR